jgi:hypothetical protein
LNKSNLYKLNLEVKEDGLQTLTRILPPSHQHQDEEEERC